MDEFWAFLDERRIADSIMAEAYEHASPQLRGLLKKNIAVQHELAEQRLPPELKRTEISYGSTLSSRSESPAPWCLIIHDAAYPAAPRALAAAIPAQLAAVPEVWSIALYDESAVKKSDALKLLSPPVLTAWELAGVENVALLGAKAFLSRLSAFIFAEKTCAAKGSGRALLLGAPDFSKDLRAILNDPRRVLLREEGPAPRILLTEKPCEAKHSILKALHPDALFESESPDKGKKEPYAAVFHSKGKDGLGAQFTAQLHLDDEHSGCWLWPELSTDFFLNHFFTLRAADKSER